MELLLHAKLRLGDSFNSEPVELVEIVVIEVGVQCEEAQRGGAEVEVRVERLDRDLSLGLTSEWLQIAWSIARKFELFAIHRAMGLV